MSGLKTYKEEVAELAKRWASQMGVSYVEATSVIARFAKQNHEESFEAEDKTND